MGNLLDLLTRHRDAARRDARGASAVEYALLVTLISLAIILGATAFGTAVAAMFNVTF